MTKEREVLGFDEADKIASMVEASRKSVLHRASATGRRRRCARKACRGA